MLPEVNKLEVITNVLDLYRYDLLSIKKRWFYVLRQLSDRDCYKVKVGQARITLNSRDLDYLISYIERLLVQLPEREVYDEIRRKSILFLGKLKILAL